MDLSSELDPRAAAALHGRRRSAPARSTIGIVEGIAEATALIVKVFSGVLSDRFRRRKPLVVLGYGLAALTKFVFPLAPTLGWIVAARFADRVGKGIRGAPRDALIADLTPPRGARRELRAAPGARHGRRRRRPAARDRRDGVFRRRLPGGVLGRRRARRSWPCCCSSSASRSRRRRRRTRRTRRSGCCNGPTRGACRRQLRDRRRHRRRCSRSRASREAFLVLRAQNVGLADRRRAVGDGVMSVVYAAVAYPAGAAADRGHGPRLLGAGLAALDRGRPRARQRAAAA